MTPDDFENFAITAGRALADAFRAAARGPDGYVPQHDTLYSSDKMTMLGFTPRVDENPLNDFFAHVIREMRPALRVKIEEPTYVIHGYGRDAQVYHHACDTLPNALRNVAEQMEGDGKHCRFVIYHEAAPVVVLS